MDKRNHGWLALGLCAGFFVLDGAFLLGVDVPAILINALSYAAIIVGLHFLWRTGTYQISPLSRFSYLAIVVFILSVMMRILHWPYAVVLQSLSLGMVLVFYSIHFFLKGRRSLGDILRLLVVAISMPLFALALLHVVSSTQAYWATIGILGLTILECLLNPRKPFAADKKRPESKEEAESEALKQQFPELFD